MQAPVVGRIASALVLAAVTPFAIACIGFPLTLLFFPGSHAVGLFVALLFSPVFAVPIALLLGFPTLVALARFWRMGPVECALAGAACALPGVYVVCESMTPGLPGARGLVGFSRGELAMIASAGAAYGSAFWAMHALSARRTRVVAGDRR